MRTPEEDKEKILERGRFLEERGFEPRVGEFGVDYCNGEIKIMAYYERYENQCGLDIKFPGNRHFQISWIAFIRKRLEAGQEESECKKQQAGGEEQAREEIGKVQQENLLGKILTLLSYLEENYEKITDLRYCEESRELLNQYFESEDWKKIKKHNKER